MITIDGSRKSGFGTIVRDAVPFSALTGEELFLTNIRANRLIQILETEATVDEHVADQLIPFCGLAYGWSSLTIPKMTAHIDTRLWLVEKMLGTKTEVKNNRLRIKGIGYRR